MLKMNLHRTLCILLLFSAGLTIANAGNTATFYYTANANVSPTGAGKVYVSSESTSNPPYRTAPASTSGSQGSINYATVTLYYYAQANDGFIFDHWAENSATGETVSTNTSFNVTRAFNGSRNSPTTFNYYAVFTAQTGLIKVKSANDNLGGVSISNPDNKITDTEPVTLTANPDISNGVMFHGWKKNNQGDLITDNPLLLTVGEEKDGTYWAYFSEPAEQVYIRLKNNKTGRFLSFYGTTKATDHTRSYSSYNNIKDGFKFNGSLKMISAADAQGNPSTVFLRSGHASGSGVTTGVDFSAHNTSYSTLVGANLNNGKYMLTMEGSSSSVRIYTTYTLSVSGRTLDLPTYLCDEGGDYAVMKTIQELSADEQSAAEWTLYSLDETTTEGAFGANTKAKFKKDGKYYTTMYTDFPYKLLDGVKAYYLVFNEDFTEITDRVVFTQVAGNLVAEKTAVILECENVQNDINSTATVTNRLLPLTEGFPTQTVNEGANFLKGYVSVNGSTVANNKKRMYVLSTNKEGVLGFHPYSKDTMTPNKAYLLIPEATDEQIDVYAKKLTFSFGEPDIVAPSDPTGIELSDQMVDEDDSTPVYNLNGTKVAEGRAAENMLRPGVYVKKGKKFVVK